MDEIKKNRDFMRSHFVRLQNVESDQNKGFQKPPIQKPFDNEKATIIKLPEVSREVINKSDIFKCIKERRSRRKFKKDFLNLEELSFLLWATQGVERIIGDNYTTLRTVPSAGARHAFETYIAVNRVNELGIGIYRYLPLSHELLFLFKVDKIEKRLNEASLNQNFVGESSCVFIWSCIPYRSEWRYSFEASGAILLDAGHVCQNLYLASEAIRCGTCAIRAYDQKAIDNLLKLDGEDEFVVYMAPVGKY